MNPGESVLGSRLGFATGAPVPQPPVWAQIRFSPAVAAASTGAGVGGAPMVSCSSTMVAWPASATRDGLVLRLAAGRLAEDRDHAALADTGGDVAGGQPGLRRWSTALSQPTIEV